MNIEEYRMHCLSMKGATESVPFPKLPDVLVFKVRGKMFTATDMALFDGFSIKCDPETIEQLRADHPSVQEPSYFSKRHWCNVVMDGTVQDQQLRAWLDTSYALVVAGLPKKVQKELDEA